MFTSPYRVILGQIKITDLNKLVRRALLYSDYLCSDHAPVALSKHYHTGPDALYRNVSIRRCDQCPSGSTLTNRPIGVSRHSLRVRLHRPPEVAQERVRVVDRLHARRVRARQERGEASRKG